MDFDYLGQDADALSLLGTYGSNVGGVDYVGATPGYQGHLGSFQQRPMQHFNSQALALMEAGKKAIDLSRKIAHDRKLRNAALAGFVPQAELPLSTAVGTTIAAGGALGLTGSAGVPCRPTKWTIEPAIASFFVITSIVMARMSVLAGGTGGVPATRWLPTANQAPIDNPYLGPGSPIVITGTNVDLAAHGFFSSWDIIDMTPASARLT